MFKVITLIFCYILFSFKAHAINNDPIVLVHGLTGWGRGEMLGFNYWGAGLPGHDIQENLNSAGFKTFTAGVGPFSSNWDRAVELYYQIKGGCVDYGAVHSARHKHARMGKCFAVGLYSPWSDKNKLHLLGHSMGGPTARTLVQLLEQGSPEELTVKDAADLFRGGKSWIRSVTTLSSPNNSATVADTPVLKQFAKELIAGISSAVGLSGDNSVYDFKLDQWNLKREPHEKFSSYAKRVFKSDVWNGEKDFSVYDLGSDGVAELNKWVKAQPNVYYFALRNQSSENTVGPFERPIASVNPLLVGIGAFIGLHAPTPPQSLDPQTPGMTWYQNDAVCNTISMNAPVGEPISLHIQKGSWVEFPVMQGFDHLDVIGHCAKCDFMSLYLSHAKLLHELD